MQKFYIVPNPMDTACVLTLDDSGIAVTAVPDTRPDGVACQSYAVPDGTPNAHGAWQVLSHPNKGTIQIHGTLAWGKQAPPSTPAWQCSFDTDIYTLQEVPVRPFEPCPRTYRGNMCGVRVPGLPPVPGGAADASLVLSWFLDRYTDADRARIYETYRGIGATDILVSWPDSRAVGATPESFGLFCQEIKTQGFEPAVMLSSKVYDPNYDWRGTAANIAPVLPYLQRVVGRLCVGFELSLWLSPADVQALTDWLAPQIVPWGGKLYVHFQEGYASFDIDGPNASFAGYWNRNIGKLTGILHQKDLSWDRKMYQDRMVDVLERFAGNFNCSPDSGFGHSWDCICLEITAQPQFNGQMSEAEGNTWGQTAINTPASHGPLGPVPVMGSGNGQ